MSWSWPEFSSCCQPLHSSMLGRCRRAAPGSEPALPLRAYQRRYVCPDSKLAVDDFLPSQQLRRSMYAKEFVPHIPVTRPRVLHQRILEEEMMMENPPERHFIPVRMFPIAFPRTPLKRPWIAAEMGGGIAFPYDSTKHHGPKEIVNEPPPQESTFDPPRRDPDNVINQLPQCINKPRTSLIAKAAGGSPEPRKADVRDALFLKRKFTTEYRSMMNEAQGVMRPRTPPNTTFEGWPTDKVSFRPARYYDRPGDWQQQGPVWDKVQTRGPPASTDTWKMP